LHARSAHLAKLCGALKVAKRSMIDLIGHSYFRKLAIATGRTVSRVRLRGLPRLMYWSGPLISARGVNTIETVSGMSFALDLSDYASCMMFYGVFSQDLVRLLSALVKAGDSLIDVGAQLGYISAHMARLVGFRGCVHSFEPDPNAVSRLRAGVQANGQEWIKIFPMAVGNVEGEIDFYVSPTLGWSTALGATHLTGLSQIKVRCASIDRLSADGEIRRPVSLVKIDTEGYECAVLDGMHRLMLEDRPFVIAEINPMLLGANHETSADVLSRFFECGYRVHRLEGARGLLSRGRFDLVLVDRPVELGFCDVLCVPEEKAVPDGVFTP
jgi:FkbM family methyltransferase